MSSQSSSLNDHLLVGKQVIEKSAPSPSIIIVVIIIILSISIMVLVDVLVFVVALDLGYLIYLSSI